MDSYLQYKNHKIKLGTKGLKAAMALRQIQFLAPATARQLFHATVASVINYALTIWAHTLEPSTDKTFRRIQKLRAQAVTGAFTTVAGGILELEAGIYSINTCKVVKSSTWLIDLCSLPPDHPLSKLDLKSRRKLLKVVRSKEVQFFFCLPFARGASSSYIGVDTVVIRYVETKKTNKL